MEFATPIASSGQMHRRLVAMTPAIATAVPRPMRDRQFEEDTRRLDILLGDDGEAKGCEDLHALLFGNGHRVQALQP